MLLHDLPFVGTEEVFGICIALRELEVMAKARGRRWRLGPCLECSERHLTATLAESGGLLRQTVLRYGAIPIVRRISP